MNEKEIYARCFHFATVNICAHSDEAPLLCMGSVVKDSSIPIRYRVCKGTESISRVGRVL